MRTMRWQYCVGVAAAAWLLLGSALAFAGWAVSEPFAPMVNAVVVAVALVIFATLSLVLRLDWNGWATLSIGAWALAAASMLRAMHAWLPVLLLGLITFALCGWVLMSTPSAWRRGDGRRVR